MKERPFDAELGETKAHAEGCGMGSNLQALLNLRLADVADVTTARAQQAYMKSAMPFYGVPKPVVRDICRDVFGTAHFDSASEWMETVRALWTGARYREERYAALLLAEHRSARAFQTPEAMPLYEFLVVDGAWWDFVDEISVRRIGPLVVRFAAVKDEMRRWSLCDDLWKRRAAIVCQVGAKEKLDWTLLVDVIEPAIGESEFFLRKAIGWALRSHAKIDPRVVAAYVHANAHRLSGLTKREALKHLGGVRD